MSVCCTVNAPAMVGKYSIAEPIGSGSYSEVRVAYNITTNQKLCVKIVPKAKTKERDELSQFAREIQTISSISHHSIIKLIDFLEDSENYYVFQELVDGVSLLKFINAAEKRLSESTCRLIYKQLISVLFYLHKSGIYHRDIKLENILITEDMTIKLIDFGFCAITDGNSLCNTICGSLKYIAPECIMGKPYLGGAADVWSSGVVLYSLVTKKLPFVGQSQPKIMQSIIECSYQMPEDISPTLVDLFTRIFTVDPDLRITAESILLHPWIIGDHLAHPLPRSGSLMKKAYNSDMSFSSRHETRRNRSFSSSQAFQIERIAHGSTSNIPYSAHKSLPPQSKRPLLLNETFVIDE